MSLVKGFMPFNVQPDGLAVATTVRCSTANQAHCPAALDPAVPEPVMPYIAHADGVVNAAEVVSDGRARARNVTSCGLSLAPA
jgi:hypothetical protein